MSAWTLLWPAGLWALLALAVPVLIHLFSRSRGKRVLTGNIELVRHARRVQVSETRLEQWLLLLLRMALLILAALILAQLALQGVSSIKGDTAYLSRGWLAAATVEEYQDVIDQHPGGAFILEPGYTAMPTSSHGGEPANPELLNTWPLLAERLQQVHHQGVVTVYSTDLAAELGNSLSPLPAPVTFKLRPGLVPQPVVHTPSLVLVHDQARSGDAQLLQSAIEVLRQHRLPGLVWDIALLEEMQNPPVDTDWLIVLSENGMPGHWFNEADRPAIIIEDMGVEGRASEQRAMTLPDYPFTRFDVRALDEQAYPGEIVWQLPTGQPLLLSTLTDDTVHLQYLSRFAPQGSSLALQAEFPQTLLQLLSPDPASFYRTARIDPATLPQYRASTGLGLPSRPVRNWLAILMILLWAVERWLSERRRKAHA